MQTWINNNLPREELKKLEFLIGEFSSWHMMWPAGGQPPVRYRSIVRAVREGCDRFLRMEQFSDVPGVGIVNSTNLYTFNRQAGLYQSYGFSSALEEPLRFQGVWENGRLVFTSHPANCYSGLERFRHTFTPQGESAWHFVEERLEVNGYVRHIAGTYVLDGG